LAGAAPDQAPDRRKWWRDVATVVAVLGLLLTLIFNTVGVWGQLDQAQEDAARAKEEVRRAEEARLYTQIGVLTQLAGAARSSQRVIDRSRLPALRCDPGYHGSDIRPRDEAELREALGVYDFMAWLFNERYLPSDEALSMWAPRLIDAAKMGERLTSAKELRTDFPQLADFYAHADRSLWPPEACPKAPPGARGRQ
jgi:hypothetical protein